MVFTIAVSQRLFLASLSPAPLLDGDVVVFDHDYQVLEEQCGLYRPLRYDGNALLYLIEHGGILLSPDQSAADLRAAVGQPAPYRLGPGGRGGRRDRGLFRLK